MSIEYQKGFNSIKRVFDNQSNLNLLYSLLFFVTVFFYGGFGVHPITKVIMRKMDTIKELEELNHKLEQKKASLANLDSELSEALFYVKDLEDTIPNKPDAEVYLLDIVRSAGKSSYSQKNMNIVDHKDGFMEISTRFEGNPALFSNFIKNIESIKRFTRINQLKFDTKEEMANVSLLLDIFYLKDISK